MSGKITFSYEKGSRGILTKGFRVDFFYDKVRMKANPSCLHRQEVIFLIVI